MVGGAGLVWFLSPFFFFPSFNLKGGPTLACILRRHCDCCFEISYAAASGKVLQERHNHQAICSRYYRHRYCRSCSQPALLQDILERHGDGIGKQDQPAVIMKLGN